MTLKPAARHRFFVDAEALRGDHVELTGPQAHQITRVLRLGPGERIIVLDGGGQEREVEIVVASPGRLEGLVRSACPSLGEPRLRITLYQALVPREKFEVVLQKGTETGVARFVPVRCERSIVPGGEAIDERRLERWRRIVQEAAEQSRRGRAPEVQPALRLAQALGEAVATGPTLVAWEGELARSLRSALTELTPPGSAGVPPALPGGGPDRLSLFVGPEGGFSAAEIAGATELGALTVSLGPRILRTETAGPVMAALALYQADELGPP